MDEIDEAKLAERVNAHIEQTLAQEAAERAMAARMAAGIDDAPSPAPTKPAPKAKPQPRPATKPAPKKDKPQAKPAPKPKAEAKPAPKKARPTLVPLEDSVEIAGGDTLWGLSKKHGISLKRLLEMNQDIDPLRMQIGQRVRLRPTPSPLPADNGMTPTDLPRSVPQRVTPEQSRAPRLPSYESQALEPVYPVESVALGGLGAGKLMQQVVRRPTAPSAPQGPRDVSDRDMDALFRHPDLFRYRRDRDPRLM